MTTTDHLATVRRAVRAGERDGTATKVVTIAQDYPVGVGELWDAVTTADRIARWLAPVAGDLRLGGRYQIQGNAGGEVLECVPTERVVVTWEFGGDVSWVVATLSGDEAASTLQVEHEAHVDQQRWEQFGPGAVGIGWDMMLLGLGLHLESGGAAVDDPQAWMAGDEGRAFMSGSGHAWLDAHLASGEDPAAARAASERCLTAYLG